MTQGNTNHRCGSPKRRLRGLVLTVALGLTAATAAAEESVTVHLNIRNGRFDPQTIDVPAGKRVRLLIRNDGPGASEFESHELRKEKVLGPDASSFVIIAPLTPGTYPFFDDFHPDTGNGRIVAR
jgi:plastocyanin